MNKELGAQLDNILKDIKRKNNKLEAQNARTRAKANAKLARTAKAEILQEKISYSKAESGIGKSGKGLWLCERKDSKGYDLVKTGGDAPEGYERIYALYAASRVKAGSYSPYSESTDWARNANHYMSIAAKDNHIRHNTH